MEFFEVVNKRRSIRRFTDEPVPDEVIRAAVEAATLAPNSSNAQTWNFFWIKSPEKKMRLVEYCLSQSAARKAQHLVVITADPSLWRRSHKQLVDYVLRIEAPKPVVLYYKKLFPFLYSWGFLNSYAPVRWMLATLVGFFRPIMRGPYTKRDSQEVAIKSAALAAENFTLAITAQGFASCMMEGFDEKRVKRLLSLRWNERVVMVIGVGKEGERGTWGPRYRLSTDQVLFEI